ADRPRAPLEAIDRCRAPLAPVWRAEERGSPSMRTMISAAANIHMIFPTPLLALDHPHAAPLNDELKTYIEACAASEPSYGRSVRYGWHSAVDFLDRDQKSVRALRGWIEDAIVKVTQFSMGEKAPPYQAQIVASWANVLGDGGYHKIHAHRNNAWAGVYYVRVPEASGESDAGNIEFPDPRGVACTIVPESYGLMFSPVSVRPREGLVLIFPAWLPHFVNPHRGTSARIAISFNAVLKAPRPRSAGSG